MAPPCGVARLPEALLRPQAASGAAAAAAAATDRARSGLRVSMSCVRAALAKECKTLDRMMIVNPEHLSGRLSVAWALRAPYSPVTLFQYSNIR